MKKNHLKDTDFLYLSTRLRAAESGLITKDKLTRVIDAADFAEAYAYVCELYGASPDTVSGYEALLDAELAGAYAFAHELIDGTVDVEHKPFELLAPFQYVYDCQNLKAVIKCRALGKQAKALISPNGTVSPEQVSAASLSGDYAAFPAAMAQAAPEAAEQLAATGDPQLVDLILDKAAFRDMSRTAEQSGFDSLARLVRTKIDSANISACLRCIRQKKNKMYFEKLFLEGGTLDKDFFLTNYDETPAKLLAALAFTAYSALAGAGMTELSASDAERLCEELYTAKAYEAASLPFGAELVILYIVRKEYEIKNVRIVLAGKSCGLSGEKIRERLRGLAS